MKDLKLYSDEKLMQGLKAYYMFAFNMLYKKYSKKLYNFSYSILKSKEESENLVKDDKHFPLKDGNLTFNKEPLSEVVKKPKNWYTVDIQINVQGYLIWITQLLLFKKHFLDYETAYSYYPDTILHFRQERDGKLNIYQRKTILSNRR